MFDNRAEMPEIQDSWQAEAKSVKVGDTCKGGQDRQEGTNVNRNNITGKGVVGWTLLSGCRRGGGGRGAEQNLLSKTEMPKKNPLPQSLDQIQLSRANLSQFEIF